MARTDYLVDSKNQMSVFLTAAKRNGKEGHVFMARTADGAKTWNFVSWIGPEPDGFSIMPSSVRLSKTRILTTLRRKEGAQHWIDAWATDYNTARPHSSLGYKTPAAYADTLTAPEGASPAEALIAAG